MYSFGMDGYLQEYMDARLVEGNAFKGEQLIALAQQCWSVDR